MENVFTLKILSLMRVMVFNNRRN